MPIRCKAASAIFALALPAGALYAQSTAGSANPDVFNQRVLPVLKANCATCHMVANPAGGLSFTSLDTALSGGKHGPAITPGDSKQSLHDPVFARREVSQDARGRSLE